MGFHYNTYCVSYYRSDRLAPQARITRACLHQSSVVGTYAAVCRSDYLKYLRTVLVGLMFLGERISVFLLNWQLIAVHFSSSTRSPTRGAVRGSRTAMATRKRYIWSGSPPDHHHHPCRNNILRSISKLWTINRQKKRAKWTSDQVSNLCGLVQVLSNKKRFSATRISPLWLSLSQGWAPLLLTSHWLPSCVAFLYWP